MKINQMTNAEIEAEIRKLETPTEAECKRTKGDESPSRRYQHLKDRLFCVTKTVILFGLITNAQASTIYLGQKLDRKTPKKVMMCRITAYWQGEDGWTTDLKSSTGRRLVSGKSCAVDPKVIPYGSNVIVEGKRYLAHDTGTAVVARKASRGAPVVDVFYKTEKQAQREMRRVGRYATVTIE
jgi:3D (Asp-Asp-Asp) domain-containing protein